MERPDAAAKLRLAARWRLLGLLLERPRTGWHREVQGLAAEADDASLAVAARNSAGVDEPTYLRVFGPGGTVSPREVAYRPMADPGKLLSRLQTLYDAFGFQPRAEEPADHVAVEAAFLGYLRLKEAFALARGEEDAADSARRAAELFAREHLAGFAGELAERLRAYGTDYLAAAAGRLADWVPAGEARTNRDSPLASSDCSACGEALGRAGQD